MSTGHPYVVDDQQVGVANLIGPEAPERQGAGGHALVPVVCGERA